MAVSAITQANDSDQLRKAAVEAVAAELVRIFEADLSALQDRLNTLKRPTAAETPIQRPWRERAGAWLKSLNWLEVFKATMAVITPAVLLYLGFAVKDQIDLAIKQQAADIAGGKEMRETLSLLYRDNIGQSEADATALAVAAFGAVGTMPLLVAYDLGGSVRRPAVERALIALSLTHKNAVCGILGTASTATALFTSETIGFAVRLRTELAC